MPSDSSTPKLEDSLKAAGIGADDPLGVLIRQIAQAADRASLGPGEIERIADRVSRESVARIDAGLWRRFRLMEFQVLVGASLACCLALTAAFSLGWYLNSTMPVQTEIGPLTPKAVRVLRMNDFNRAVERCQEVPQAGGGTACAVVLRVDGPD